MKNYSRFLLSKQKDQANPWSSGTKNKFVSTFSNEPQNPKYFINSRERVKEIEINKKPKLNKSMDIKINKDNNQNHLGILNERTHLKKELSNQIRCLNEQQDKVGQLKELYKNLSNTYSELKNLSQKEENSEGKKSILEKNMAKKDKLDVVFQEACLTRADKLKRNKSFLSEFLKTSCNKF